MAGKRVIIDTDYTTDVGDCGALAVALSAHRMGYITLQGIIVNTSYPYAPGGACAQAEWWGVTGLTYGCWKGTALEDTIGTPLWVKDVYDNFDHTEGLASSVTDSTDAYRTMLAAAPDRSVDIVSIGFMTCLSALLDSDADGISGLTGAELVEAKVRSLWVMGGSYPSGSAEYNFKGGESAVGFVCTATNNVCSNWPSPIRFIGFEAGTFTAGGTFGRATTDLISKAYTTHGSTSGRTAWDEQAVLACIQEGAEYAWHFGSQTVNTTTGVNTWTASNSGKDAYLTKAITDAKLQAKINVFIGATVTDSPLLTTWGSAQSTLQLQAA